jgi:hypothetical protein
MYCTASLYKQLISFEGGTMQLINRGPGLRKLAVAAPQESQLHHLGTDFLAVLEILSNPQCLHASITLFCLLAVERA